MENDINKVSNLADQLYGASKEESEKREVFINVMVQIVEKYGKSVLQGLDSVA